MTTDVAVPEMDMAQAAQLLGLNPRDPKTAAMVAVCQRYQLDPLLKHVVVIPGSGVYITRDGLLHVAHRSDQLDGIEIVEGPELVTGEWRATVVVYRKDMAHPFRFPGRYSTGGKNKQYAQEMAVARAESAALRRAFDITGIAGVDEIDVQHHVAAEPEPEPKPARKAKPKPKPSGRDYAGESLACMTADELRELWKSAHAEGALTDQVQAAIDARLAELRAWADAVAEEPGDAAEPIDAELVDEATGEVLS